MDSLDKYIIVLKDIIPNELCSKILNEYVDCNDWVSTGVGDGTANKEIRNCDTIEISQLFILNNNPNRLEIDKGLFEVASECISHYNELFTHSYIQEDTGYELLRYQTGGFYTEHVDSFLQAPRLITASFCLNDNYDGGEFAFFNEELKYQLHKGDVIMFPSNFMYPHKIMPITRGTRYSIVTWFR